MPAQKKWTTQEIQQVVAMAADGMSMTEIARTVRVSRDTLLRYMARNNLRTVRYRMKGAAILVAAQQQAPADPDDTIRDLRDPLPPGHPLSWRECLGMHVSYPVSP